MVTSKIRLNCGKTKANDEWLVNYAMAVNKKE